MARYSVKRLTTGPHKGKYSVTGGGWSARYFDSERAAYNEAQRRQSVDEQLARNKVKRGSVHRRLLH